MTAAAGSRADAVLIDLAAPVPVRRGDARAQAAAATVRLATAGRLVQTRVSSAASGELAADVEAVVGPSIEAIVLSGAEQPQDVRDADVAIRRHEMRLGLTPGAIRLIPEIDSAAGLQSLGGLLAAVDRHGAVLLDIDAWLDDLGVPATAPARADVLAGHALAWVAVAARVAGLPWLIAASGSEAGARAAIATQAHAAGATGCVVMAEPEVAGLNELFLPDPGAIAVARQVVAEWERVRSRGDLSGVVEGRLVDRRTVRRARQFIATAEQIEARRHVRSGRWR